MQTMLQQAAVKRGKDNEMTLVQQQEQVQLHDVLRGILGYGVVQVPQPTAPDNTAVLREMMAAQQANSDKLEAQR